MIKNEAGRKVWEIVSIKIVLIWDARFEKLLYGCED
jgi:hypothetical protein